MFRYLVLSGANQLQTIWHKTCMNLSFGGASGEEPACQCRRFKRQRYHPWVRKIPWKRAWQPTPVFLPGKPHGQRSLVDYSPQSPREPITTMWLSVHACSHTHTASLLGSKMWVFWTESYHFPSHPNLTSIYPRSSPLSAWQFFSPFQNQILNF